MSLTKEQYQRIFALLQLIFFLYLFVFSLQLMGDSLKLFGSGFSRTLIETTSNPFVGLFIGILSTSIIQSSSSTSAIVVGMVAGGALTIDSAIPIIMGANIGTSITTTIAAIPQMNRSNEFRKAFSAATVHDFFNFLAVLVIFPLQLATNFLGHAAAWLEVQFQGVGGLKFLSPVKAVTKPVSGLLIEYLGELPWLLLAIALLCLFLALKNIVTALKALIVNRARAWVDEILFKTPVRAFIVGIGLTFLVQSSSITTSLIVPMAGAGILTLGQIFPYTLGANIGTTFTAILAALITGQPAAVTVAFAHLLFNISGIAVWWPLKVAPISIARNFADLATRAKIIPILYLLIMFFLIPVFVIFISN